MLSVSQYLERLGVSLFQIVGFVRPLARDEALLLVGSVGEGLANDDSDLDVLLIERSSPTATLPADTIRAVPVGFDLNVEHLAHASALHLGERFADSLRVAAAPGERQSARPMSFLGDDDLRLLHRLRTGIVLHDPSELVTALRRTHRLDELPEWCVLQHLACHRRLQADARAALAFTADRHTPLLMCQLAARRLIGAILAAVGETNPNPKWAMRLLCDHADATARFDPARLVELALCGGELDPGLIVRRLDAASRTATSRLVDLARARHWTVAPALFELTGPSSSEEAHHDRAG